MRSIGFIFLLFLLACSEENLKPEDNKPDLKPLSTQAIKLVEAGNDFALELTKKVNDTEDGNFFISPLSVGYALGMTFNGAAGETKSDIKQALDFGDLTDEEINQSYLALTSQLTGMDKKVLMEIANSIWYRQDLTVKSRFKEIMAQFYDAGVAGLDFSDPASKDAINNWIENKTHDKIKDMLDQIPPEAVMYLVNAIYFKAEWTHQFEKSATKKESFKLAGGGETQVDMMFSKGAGISFFRGDKYSYIELPYGNRQFVMAILLPDEGYSPGDVIDGLDYAALKNLSEKATRDTVEVKLPKFKLEYKRKLNDDLIAMGMGRAFSDQAEFPELFEESIDLMISRVLHQSFIEVNEEGSEAAAATIVEIIERVSFPPVPRQIVINRPFAFFIMEKHTNTILFAGKMMNPGQ